jgi:hypothetical protein
MVVVALVPVVTTLSGLRVNVHVPVEGKPLNTTLPVNKIQVGCVIVPTEGAVGAPVTVFMVILVVAEEIQPAAFITVKVNVPLGKPVTVVLVPVPVVVTPPGLRVNVHVPVEGKPLRATLPVETLQVGCVTVPTEGGVGALGAALTIILAEGNDTQPLMVTVYV